MFYRDETRKWDSGLQVPAWCLLLLCAALLFSCSSNDTGVDGDVDKEHVDVEKGDTEERREQETDSDPDFDNNGDADRDLELDMDTNDTQETEPDLESDSDSPADGDLEQDADLELEIEFGFDFDIYDIPVSDGDEDEEPAHEPDTEPDDGWELFLRPEEPLFGDCVPGTAKCSEDRTKGYLCSYEGKWELWATYRPPAFCAGCEAKLDHIYACTGSSNDFPCTGANGIITPSNAIYKYGERPIVAVQGPGGPCDLSNRGEIDVEHIRCKNDPFYCGEGKECLLLFYGDTGWGESCEETQWYGCFWEEQAKVIYPCANGCTESVGEINSGMNVPLYESARCLGEEPLVVFNHDFPNDIVDRSWCSSYMGGSYYDKRMSSPDDYCSNNGKEELRCYHGMCIPTDSPYCQWSFDCTDGKTCVEGICQPYEPSLDGDLEQPVELCGNGVVDAENNEVCDPGMEVLCSDLGRPGSTQYAVCKADCSGWEEDNCLCGNGQQDPGEVCELGQTESCEALGVPTPEAEAVCARDCAKWNPTSCSVMEAPEWIPIPAGTYQMGCVPQDTLCIPDESPRHPVTVDAFEISETEVAYVHYLHFLNSHGAACDNHSCVDMSLGALPFKERDGVWNMDLDRITIAPMSEVTWYGAKAFCEWVGGRLPTEAEWEYAARTGSDAIYACGDDPACLETIAWYDQNYYHQSSQLEPNAWGLYDMQGNVWEWVADCWHLNYDEAPGTGTLWEGGDCTYRGVRGGGWYHNVQFVSPFLKLRVSNRDWYPPDYSSESLGFRCVRDIQESSPQ